MKIKSFEEIFRECNNQNFGTLKDVVDKFAQVAINFSKFIKPFSAFCEEHKQELLQEARGDNDYQSLQNSLINLAQSINAFSRLWRNIGNNPQQFVDQLVRWINSIIEDMNLIQNFSVENNPGQDDIALFEQAKQSYQKAMIASKNLYELLEGFNKNQRQLFDLSKWPTKYF
ncbi:MAG: hypothetical protein Pg6C_19190 [Treponemataceae bacterium]|nr:MAG: hypothetical protein Pg6C_19190 [Treponemataceae bacterium]